MAFPLSVNDVVAVTLKVPHHFPTNVGATATATGAAAASSLQTIKEFSGTVTAVDSTTGGITIRGTVPVGALSKSIDLIVFPQNLIAITRQVNS
jgi:hypothetical protein